MRKQLLREMIDSLDRQLHYFLTRIQDFPEDTMIAMVEDNIRERLQKMRDEIK